MKKKILMAIAVVAVLTAGVVTLSSFSISKKTNAAPYPRCERVLGVTMTFESNGNNHTVNLENTNDFPVMVIVNAYGYKNGDRRRVYHYEGKLADKSYTNSKKYTGTFTSDAEDITPELSANRCEY